MWEFGWDLVQQSQIMGAKHTAADAKRSAKSATQRVEDLEKSMDRLLMISRAMWEIIQQLHPVSDEQLAMKIQEIDMRDGRPDGKLDKKTIQHCGKCGKVLNKRHSICIYCGSPDLTSGAFEKVK